MRWSGARVARGARPFFLSSLRPGRPSVRLGRRATGSGACAVGPRPGLWGGRSGSVCARGGGRARGRAGLGATIPSLEKKKTPALRSHLALAALGVGPVLVLHLAGDAHQVGLDDIVLDGVQALGWREGGKGGGERHGESANRKKTGGVFSGRVEAAGGAPPRCQFFGGAAALARGPPAAPGPGVGPQSSIDTSVRPSIRRVAGAVRRGTAGGRGCARQGRKTPRRVFFFRVGRASDCAGPASHPPPRGRACPQHQPNPPPTRTCLLMSTFLELATMVRVLRALRVGGERDRGRESGARARG